MSTPGQPHAPAEPPAFQQRLGLFDATMLIMGTMIGSGIFVVSSSLARDVGSSGWLMAAWVLTGVMTVVGALSYAELAGMMPHAGGQYVYLREAYSPLPGFLYGWTCLLVIQTGSIAAVAVVFAKYLGVFIPELGTDADDARTWLVLPTIKLDPPLVIKMWLPWQEEWLTIFKRKTFTITAGQFVAVAVIGLLTLLNCRGVREGKWVQNIMTVTKVFALGLLIVVGLTLAFDRNAVAKNLDEPFAGIKETNSFASTQKDFPSMSPILVMLMVAGASMTGALFSADAWNNVTFTAGEIRNPRRNLPLSLALGTGIVIVLYLLANLAYMSVLPVRGNNQLFTALQKMDRDIDHLRDEDREAEADALESKKKELMSDATTFDRGMAYVKDERLGTAVLEEVWKGFGVPFMAAAIMISTFGCVNGMILMGARLYYAMAQDRLFFRSVGSLNSRSVPAMGLFLQGIWAMLLVFTGSYDQLLDFVMFTVLVFYVLTVGGLFILRWRQPSAERPYKAFGYPVLPALYVLACAAICVVLLIVKPENTWPGLIITLAGIPVYFFWKLQRRGV